MIFVRNVVLPGVLIFVNFITAPAQEMNCNRKGTYHFSWGYNRAQFTDSDIHYWGPGYEVLLHDVAASDRPSDLNLRNYVDPARLAIPQFNIRFGYFLNEHWSISLGYDHMKYVVKQWQTVLMTGVIRDQVSAEMSGAYLNDPVMISPGFFDYEHTNGLNYLSAEIDYVHAVFRNKAGSFRLNLEGGFGGAAIIPRSDIVLFGVQGADEFHLAGFGLGLNGGVRFEFGKHFFFRTNVKTGFISLPDVLTFRGTEYGASQHFFFLEEYGTLGYSFKLGNKKNERMISPEPESH